MKFRLSVITIITALSFSCSDDTEKTKSVPETIEQTPTPIKSSFNEFYNSLPIIEFPINIECGFRNTLTDEKYRSTYKHLIPKDFECVGRVNSSNNSTSLILFAAVGDILYPYLYSFNDNGEVIDSIRLHNGNCNSDPDFAESTSTIIDSNLVIRMFTKTHLFNFQDTDSGYTRRLDSISTSNHNVQIQNNGKFSPIGIDSTKSEELGQVIKPNTVVLIYPSDDQIEFLKNKYGESTFYVSADDNNFYMSNLIETLDSLNVTQIVSTESNLLFKGNTEDYPLTIGQIEQKFYWKALLFNGKESPIELNLTAPELDLEIINSIVSKE